MEVISSLTSSPFFLIFSLIVVAGILISIISSAIKKSGQVAATGATHAGKGIFKLIKAVFLSILYVIQIIFLVLALALAYLFNRK